MHIQIISAFLLLTQQCCFTSAASSLLRRQHPDVSQLELDTRIIGGTESVEDRYPYAVSLRNEQSHFCGGSLISKDVALTAAHCQQESYYYVVISQHDMVEYYDGEALYVKHDLPHPNYIEETNDADIMLVFLDGAFENADVVRLNWDSSVPAVGQEVTVMGWGDFKVDPAVSSISDVLMNVNVNVVSNEECEASEGVVDGYFMTYENQITDNMLCAWAPQRDSCQGVRWTFDHQRRRC